jgi:hypothetical protein
MATRAQYLVVLGSVLSNRNQAAWRNSQEEAGGTKDLGVLDELLALRSLQVRSLILVGSSQVGHHRSKAKPRPQCVISRD